MMATPSHSEMHYYGDFYKLDGHRCRSTLEIVTCTVPADERNQLLSCQPDIVVVMMNPGKSRPCEGGDGQGRRPHAIGTGAHLVPTCPDKTQQALVKVMRSKGFRHARVLNLSDVSEPKSTKFLDDIRHNRLPQGYSVFCSVRNRELQCRLNPTTGIVIVAWGKNYRLRKLAETAIGSFNSFGLRFHGWGNQPLFYHPARRSKQWPRWILSNWP